MAYITISKNLSDLNLLKEYIENCICSENLPASHHDACFDPWEVCGDFRIIYKISTSIVSVLQSYQYSFDAIICLSDSGIPLSCVLSRMAEKDLFIYKKKKMKLEDIDQEVPLFPIPNGHRRFLIVDSDINTGTTLSSCVSHLRENYVFESIAAFSPIILDESVADLPEMKDVHIYSLASANFTFGVVSSLLNITEKDEVTSVFSNHPSAPISNEISFLEEPNTSSKKIRRMFTRFRSHLHRDIKFPLLNDDLSNSLKLFGSKESDIWQMVSQAEVMKLLCETILGEENINEYDCLVGTGYLGTYLAFELAASAQFQGRVLSMIKKGGWGKPSSTKKSTEALVCIGRIRTGNILRDVIPIMKKYGIHAKAGIAIRQTKEGVARKYSKSLNTVPSYLPDLKVLSRGDD